MIKLNNKFKIVDKNNTIDLSLFKSVALDEHGFERAYTKDNVITFDRRSKTSSLPRPNFSFHIENYRLHVNIGDSMFEHLYFDVESKFKKPEFKTIQDNFYKYLVRKHFYQKYSIMDELQLLIDLIKVDVIYMDDIVFNIKPFSFYINRDSSGILVRNKEEAYYSQIKLGAYVSHAKRKDEENKRNKIKESLSTLREIIFREIKLF